ncbi:MAG: hypothetical protein KGV46_03195 [Pasteurella sp.]|nr:hypothetical protein [Pasteurella sp.]
MARSSKSFVIDPVIFSRLMEAIDAYVGENKENVKKVDDYIFEQDNKLIQIKELLERRVEDAQIKLRNKDHKLTLCEMTPVYDSEGNPKEPSCGSERRARKRAKRQLDVAEKVMSQMNELLRYADKYKQEYEDEKNKMMSLLENKLPVDKQQLKKHDEIMQEYLRLNIE